MREAVKNKTAKILTLDLAKELKGKRIRTIYFGYKGQDGGYEFIVGDTISEYELALREDFSRIDERFKNRAEYWESYMSKEKLNQAKSKMVLLCSENKNTLIFAHEENHGIFTCSDIDRFVYFIEVL